MRRIATLWLGVGVCLVLVPAAVYGLFGTLQAKLGGMSHVWSEFAGVGSGLVRPKTNYRFTICLNCQGESSKFMQQKDHAGVVNKVVGGTLTCTKCHHRSHAGQGEGRPS
jgi:hypothetical protein